MPPQGPRTWSDTQVVDYVESMFASTYAKAIPVLLGNDAAYVAFVTMMVGIEALAGYAFPEKESEARFKSFVSRYFSAPLSALANELYRSRCALVHGFSTGPFGLAPSASVAQDRDAPPTTLYADQFLAALTTAASQFFPAARADNRIAAGMRTKLCNEGFFVS